MDRQETLLPCPLPACGGEAINQGRGILCRRCGIWLGDGTQARESGGAHKLWNTRPDSPAKYVPEPSDGVMYCRPQMERDFKAGWDAANAPLLQEIAALKGDLRLEDLPPEGARTKLDEWQACYAALFRQMNEAVAKHVALLGVVRVAYDTLQTIHYANAGDSPQTTEMARLASEALRPFLPEIEEKKE